MADLNNLFEAVSLYAAPGADQHFVVEVIIPRFATGIPGIIIWGQRIFLYDEEMERHVEKFAYYAVVGFNPLTGLPDNG